MTWRTVDDIEEGEVELVAHEDHIPQGRNSYEGPLQDALAADGVMVEVVEK
tara:strand:+ start:1697 stop:1849 length:153 start_codon:yes stop_codon:yes gene_type:complete